MINAIIIDDEKDGAEVLEILLKQNCPEIHILSLEHTVEGAIHSIETLKPDLVFLDIEMTTGTGFEVIEATKQIEYETVFITAYEHYAIKAFKTNAVDYLLKPIDVEELGQAVKNAEKRILNSIRNREAQLDGAAVTPVQKNKKIQIPSQDGILLVDVNDIIRLEADSNYTHVYIKNRKKLMVAKTLKSFEEQLDKKDFFRVHHTHLINMGEVERYMKGDGGVVVLKDGVHIPVSRTYKNSFLEKIKLYL